MGKREKKIIFKKNYSIFCFKLSFFVIKIKVISRFSIKRFLFTKYVSSKFPFLRRRKIQKPKKK